ncbi:MAG: SPASM domain-containing protein [Acidobacteria bacterium]|nr:SPASM domain-containing protein [Acidobacteriota bacterium]
MHFSTRCGAACSFCYFSDPLAQKLEPTGLDKIEAILEKLSSEGVREVLFVGGDPVIHPKFFESLQKAKSLGLVTSVLSNSWAIRPANSFEAAVNLIDNCEATFLGSNPTTHDELTQRPGSYSALVSNLKSVVLQGKSIGVCTNAMPRNLREVYDTVRVLINDHRIPVRSLMVQRIIPSGASSGRFKFGLNLDDVDVLMRQIDRVARDFDVPILFEDPVPWCTVDTAFHKYLARCEWGYARGAISATGELNRCGADDKYRLGSVWEGSIQDIWNSHPILKSFRSKRYLPGECQSCDLLQKCGGGCPLSCGTLRDHDLDQLYRDKVDRGAAIHGTPNDSRAHTRYAVEDDLPSIVRLEQELFGSAAPVFTSENITRLFARCPKAFRVVLQENKIQGYSVVFPLTQVGTEAVRVRQHRSITEMSTALLAERVSSNVAAFYLEVVAVRPDADTSAAASLIRDAL